MVAATVKTISDEGIFTDPTGVIQGKNLNTN
jgi:hypothetical protein